MGVINILNRAYVVRRSGVGDREIGASLLRHARFRIAQFAIGMKTEYGRDRLAGAMAAYRVLPKLLRCPTELLDSEYIKLRQSCLDLPA